MRLYDFFAVFCVGLCQEWTTRNKRKSDSISTLNVAVLLQRANAARPGLQLRHHLIFWALDFLCVGRFICLKCFLLKCLLPHRRLSSVLAVIQFLSRATRPISHYVGPSVRRSSLGFKAF